jgi:Nucleotidyl transferase AbiEii toxin, Type IV TA system
MGLLPKDLRELLALFHSHEVDFVVVGALALAWHGRPRFTSDIDLLVRPGPENAARIMRALREFGFGGVGIEEKDFLRDAQVVQLGNRPVRADLMTSISGVTNEEVWSARVPGEIDGVPVFFLDRDSLVKNKRASGRPQDLRDIDILNGRRED